MIVAYPMKLTIVLKDAAIGATPASDGRDPESVFAPAMPQPKKERL